MTAPARLAVDTRARVTIVGLVLAALLIGTASCSAAEVTSTRSGRALAPGEPDVELPDPGSLPKAPAPDAGAAPSR